MSSDNAFPFRRLTEPLLLPVGPESQTTAVPSGFIPQGAKSFLVVNRNPFWVRLRGANAATSSNPAGLVVTPDTGWLFPPGFWGVFSTQQPEFMATISVPFMGIPAGTGTLEVSYGGGGGGHTSGFLPPPASQNVNDAGGSLTVDTGTAGQFNITPSSLPAGAIAPVRARNVNQLIAKASAGNLFSATVTAGGADGWMVVLDRNTVPAINAAFVDGEVLFVSRLLANGVGAFGTPEVPDRFANGCVVLFSGSPTTYTAPNPAAVLIRAKVL